LSQTHGKIKANSKEEIEIHYKPHINNSVDNHAYTIMSNAGNGQEFIIRATTESLKISSTSSQINFGDIESKNYVTRSFYLQNQSKIDAKFEFINDSKTNVFKILNPIGKIPAETTRKITIIFHPVELGP